MSKGQNVEDESSWTFWPMKVRPKCCLEMKCTKDPVIRHHFYQRNRELKKCALFVKHHSILRLVTAFATSWILSMLQLNETNEMNAISICAQCWCISVYFLFKMHCKATSTLLLAYLTCHCYQTVCVFWFSDQFNY
jgi:hypothetical protein